jgi:inorganic pyrophosphatase
MYELSKVLPEGMAFPYDFGFVPDTHAQDGDPLDVLVLTDKPLFPGCLAECSLLGVSEMDRDAEGAMTRNATVLSQIEAFFVNYQNVRNIKMNVLRRQGPDRPHTILQKSREK